MRRIASSPLMLFVFDAVSAQKHAVAIAEKTISMLDRMPVCRQDVLAPGKALTSISRLDCGRWKFVNSALTTRN